MIDRDRQWQLHIESSEAKSAASVAEMRSFMGLVQHRAKFVSNFLSVTDPLWELTQEDKPFQWGQRQQRAFDEVKSLISLAPILVHYQRGVHTRLIIDAQQWAVLELQRPDGHYRPVVARQDLSTFRKGCISGRLGCQAPYLVLAGYTRITSNMFMRMEPIARVLKFVLRLQQYNYIIKRIHGHPNLTDYLSHQPIGDEDMCHHATTEDFVRSIVLAAALLVLTAKEVEQVLCTDPELTCVRQYVT